jgi:hypothetical protein
MTSIVAFTLPSCGVYAASKGAVEHLTKALAKEIGGDHHRARDPVHRAAGPAFRAGGAGEESRPRQDLALNLTALARVWVVKKSSDTGAREWLCAGPIGPPWRHVRS